MRATVLQQRTGCVAYETGMYHAAHAAACAQPAVPSHAREQTCTYVAMLVATVAKTVVSQSCWWHAQRRYWTMQVLEGAHHKENAPGLAHAAWGSTVMW